MLLWASMICGFGLSVALYLAPDTPGDVAERAVPFFVSLGVLLALRRLGAVGS